MDFSKIRNYLFLGLLLLVSVFFLKLLRPFGYSIFWAAVLAGLFYPTYKKINKSLRHPNLSTVITLSLIGVIIIVPLLIVSTLVVHESINVYGKISSNVDQIKNAVVTTFNTIKDNPLVAQLNIDEGAFAEKVSQYSGKGLSYIYDSAVTITQSSFEFFFMFALMLYALFFFIRDGDKLLKKIMYLSPLGDKYEKTLYNRFIATTRASLKGTILIALLQGSLGGILFAVVGIPAALIWGVVMVFASLVPSVGSAIVWLPAAIIMFLLGNIWEAIVIVAIGAGVIGTIDNFLRPYLVGKDLSMHPLIILFSILGGLVMFGISGFVIGPIIAALFLSFWDMYAQYYKEELSNN